MSTFRVTTNGKAADRHVAARHFAPAKTPTPPILFQQVTHMASSLGNGKNKGQEVNLAPVSEIVERHAPKAIGQRHHDESRYRDGSY
jgi:hypothetical protein